MQKLFIMLTAVVGMFLGSLPAQAADTWLPNFDPAQHVYVDAKMSSRINLPADFEAQVKAHAPDGLNVYIVVTEQGDELSSSTRDNWAPNMLHTRLWERWRYESGFSEDRILIILYVRSKDSDAGSTAVRVGSYMQGKGFTREHFSSSNGPVIPTIKKHMRAEPATALLTILDNVNAELKAGGVSGTSWWSTPGWFGWTYGTWTIIIIVVVVLLLIILIARASGGGSGSSSGGWFVSTCGGGGD